MPGGAEREQHPPGLETASAGPNINTGGAPNSQRWKAIDMGGVEDGAWEPENREGERCGTRVFLQPPAGFDRSFFRRPVRYAEP